MTNTLEGLGVEVKNIKEDISEIKQDYKEIKKEAKENNRLLNENINKLTQSNIQQTEILKNQEKQFTQRLTQVSQDINGLDSKIQRVENELHTSTKWYQKFLSDNFGKVIKGLIIALLIVSGFKIAGVDLVKLILSL